MENCEIVARNDALFQELKKHPANSKEYREVESELVKINMRLVTHIAKGFFPFVESTLVKDDLVSEGCVGLVRAVRSFKPEKQIAFSTYANRCIQNAIIVFLKRESKTIKASSLEAPVNEYQYGNKRKLKDKLVSPINIEEDFADNDETDRQITWIRNHLDRLAPLQRQVIIAKYLSGEASLIGNALAKKFNCTKQNISLAEIAAVNKLRKMFYQAYPEEIAPTKEDTLTKQNLSIKKPGKKLTTLRGDIQGNGHLKGISANLENVM